MHLVNLDAYFRLASRGHKEALSVLYKMFKESAKIEMLAARKNISNFAGFPEDFHDLLDNLFFGILNDYDPDRGSFTWYMSFILEKKLSPKVKKAIIETQHFKMSDELLEDEDFNVLDNIPDPNQLEVSSDLAINNFKYSISTPKRNLNQTERLQQKILLLQYAGYSNREICEKLKLTKAVLRYQIALIKQQDTMLNLKLDLK